MSERINSISPIDIHTSPASMEVLTSSDIEMRGFADMQELLNSISSINITSFMQRKNASINY